MVKCLGLLDIECDAPPYAIVQAGHLVGLRCPEDVRWCRLSGPRPPAEERRPSPAQWAQPVSPNIPALRTRSCVCGRRLPLPVRCTFTFNTGRQVRYWMGQCRHCRTIFWDEA
jgi:hypothetical protein